MIRDRTRLKSVGKVRRLRSARLRALWPALLQRAAGRCEVPWCRSKSPPLDPHHVIKRSQGGKDVPENVVVVCRADHDATDLPVDDPRKLRFAYIINEDLEPNFFLVWAADDRCGRFSAELR